MAVVLFAPEALRDLREIKAYIAERNPVAATRIIADCERTANLLASSPELGRSRDDLVPGLRSIVGAAPYVLFYRYRKGDDLVEVARVLHGHRDVGSVLGH